MGRIEKTVFISYRRDHGGVWARAIYQDLVANGYDAFFDFQSIDSGDFSRIILENIKARAHFLVLLAPSALERCDEPNDWLRREIETAIDYTRNIVPVLLESFDFGNPDAKKVLTGKLATLKGYNGLRIYSEYFEEGMARLRTRYLNTTLDAVLHPVSHAVEQATKEQQFEASKAQPVKQKELTSSEWFARGFRATDPSEKIRYYSEAIHLKPDYADAYSNRGLARHNKGDLEGAIKDYTEAIRLKSGDAGAYFNRGIVFSIKGDHLSALSDFQKASERAPDQGKHRSSLVRVLRLLGRFKEAKEQEEIARKLIQSETKYEQACFESICGHTDKALELLKTALEKDPPPAGKKWVRQDPDFENIRDDPRFKELVGE